MARIEDLKGFIDWGSGFKLRAQIPLDARFAGEDLEFLDSIISARAAYPGLRVFIVSENKYYSYTKGTDGNYSFREDTTEFTDSQKAVLDSGITKEKVDKIETLEQNINNKYSNEQIDSKVSAVSSEINSKISTVANPDNKVLARTEVQDLINERVGTGDLATKGDLKNLEDQLKPVAKTGAYSDLEGKPTKLSQFDNDSNFIKRDEVDDVVQAEVEKALEGIGSGEATNEQVLIKVNGLETNFNQHKENKLNPHSVTKEQVGLGNVDNTADINKPVSNAQATAIATAKSEAISSASTDATSKANAARDAAIQAASSDATNKANAAETNAKAYADSIIGNVDTSALDAKIKTNSDNISKNTTDISSLKTRVTGVEEGLDSKVSNETYQSHIADMASTLAGKADKTHTHPVSQITGLDSYATDTEVTNKVATETERAMNKEAEIESSLNNEVTRATTKETQIENKITSVETKLTAEETTRKAKDDELTSAIATERRRIDSIENRGLYIGTFDHENSLPKTTPYNGLDIDINDFAIALVEVEDGEGNNVTRPGNYVVTKIEGGSLTWTLAFVYSIDLSGKVDKNPTGNGYLPKFDNSGNLIPTSFNEDKLIDTEIKATLAVKPYELNGGVAHENKDGEAVGYFTVERRENSEGEPESKVFIHGLKDSAFTDKADIVDEATSSTLESIKYLITEQNITNLVGEVANYRKTEWYKAYKFDDSLESKKGEDLGYICILRTTRFEHNSGIPENLTHFPKVRTFIVEGELNGENALTSLKTAEEVFDSPTLILQDNYDLGVVLENSITSTVVNKGDLVLYTNAPDLLLLVEISRA